MQIKKILFLLSLLVFIVSSCSVEKRVHTAGYHIDWNSQPSRLQQKELSLTKKHKTFNSFRLSGQGYQENIKAIPTAKVDLIMTPANDPKKVKAKISKLVAFAKSIKAEALEVMKPNKIAQEPESSPNTDSKYDSYAILSFLVGVLSVLIALISLNWALSLYIGALILGIISLVRIHDNPRLKGKWFAVLGLGLFPSLILVLFIWVLTHVNSS
jgi:hypothetical protein